MLTSEQFIEKIEQILNYYNLSASLFAEKIGVQRSSLSHLLSGRNKPSLDFVIKIVEEFPEVDLYWFLFNQGSFPKEEKKENPITENRIFEKKYFENSNNEISSREIMPLNLFDNEQEEAIFENKSQNNSLITNSPITNSLFQESNKPNNSLDNISNHKVVDIFEDKKTEFHNSTPTNIIDSNINSEKKPNFSTPELKINPKIKKLILIYEDGFFEEYNYR